MIEYMLNKSQTRLQMSAGIIWSTIWDSKLSQETNMIDFYGPQWEDASWILSGKTQF